jgi:(R)-2-hydroxyacyl-CoA dehydratese activating ATPase
LILHGHSPDPHRPPHPLPKAGHRGVASSLFGFERDPHARRREAAGMDYFAGIDVGSLSTDAVILDEKGEISGFSIVETGANSTRAAEAALDKALTRAGLERSRIRRIVSTGYGRASVPFADKALTEISCHALGAHALFPDTGMVIDIGGQDSKVIKVGPGGKVVDFTMNDKCAAGTGRFLEVMASKLQVPLNEMGDISLKRVGEVRISSVCTVFAESEVVSLVAGNHPKEEILRGLHRAIVNRVWSMVTTLGVRLEVTMSGGVAKNKGVVAFMEQKLGRPLLIYGEPQIIGALGAALRARDLDSSRL